ncbi:MAG: FtsX-like permease family protein [Vicinamibacterales bacterium]
MTLGALGFAWRSLRRQPARATLGILGVAAVGALLFDMLMLSNGLVLSMRDVLDRAGFDLRVTATDALPGQGPRLPRGVDTAQTLAALPAVRSAIALRFASATLDQSNGESLDASLQGIGGTGIRPWTLLTGRDVNGRGEALINESTARTLNLKPGSMLPLHPTCGGASALPVATVVVVGVATFPFDSLSSATIVTSMETLGQICGNVDVADADLIMVASSESAGSQTAAEAIRNAVPELQVLTNAQLVGRLERGGFSYFRQISTVLTTVTLAFAVLLITVLLTVSVNQRLGDIAALRALGFTRGRVVADVLSESGLIVGIGGALSIPLGLILALGLDGILKRIPGIPSDVHFFVFEGRALGLQVALLAGTALAAALYPVSIVARLPIAATLRNEVVG